MDASNERFIRRTLRRLAKQSVAMVLQPDDVLVVALALAVDDEDTEAALRTCHLRGWVEVLHGAVPHADIDASGHLPEKWDAARPVYRLTDAGWHVINRTHAWTVAIFAVALATLVAAVVAAYLAGLALR